MGPRLQLLGQSNRKEAIQCSVLRDSEPDTPSEDLNLWQLLGLPPSYCLSAAGTVMSNHMKLPFLLATCEQISQFHMIQPNKIGGCMSITSNALPILGSDPDAWTTFIRFMYLSLRVNISHEALQSLCKRSCCQFSKGA